MCECSKRMDTIESGLVDATSDLVVFNRLIRNMLVVLTLEKVLSEQAIESIVNRSLKAE